jgi:anti-sigma B factor antagonist
VTRRTDSPRPGEATDAHGRQNGRVRHALPAGGARPALTVGEFRDASTLRLSLQGELDMATRAQVESALIAAEDSGATVVELDLSGLTFMDSSGVHVALEARSRAREKGYTLVVLEGTEMVQKVFKLTGTDHLLEFRTQDRRPPRRFDSRPLGC